MSADRRRLVAAVAAAGVFLAGAVVGRATGPTPEGPAPGPDPAASEFAAVAEGEPVRNRAARESTSPSREGAVRAATRYMLLLDGAVLIDGDRRTEAIRAVAARNAEPSLQRSLGQVAELITSRLGLKPVMTENPGFVWRSVPAGWHVRSYDGREATVAIWGTGVIVFEGRQLNQPGWRTTEVTIRWERGKWRLVGFRSEDGPTPPAAGDLEITSVGRLINDFHAFDYAVTEGGG